jgi:hypothetical protein
VLVRFGGGHELAADTTAASRFGHHDLLDPRHRAVGVEGQVAGGQQVAGDLAARVPGHEHDGVFTG